MTQAQGSSSRLLLLPESTWGTKPSVTPGDSEQIHFENEGLDCSQPRDANPHITSSRNYGSGVLGQMDCGGPINMKLNPLSHGQILRALLGAPTTTGAGPYTHAFEVGSTLPSFTIEKGFTDVDQYFWLTGMTCASATFTFNTSGFLDVSTTWLGKGEDDSSPATSSMDSAPTNNGDTPFEMTNADMVITEGGSAIATVTALTFTVDNEADGSNYTIAAAGKRGSVPVGKCRVTGQLTAMFENSTLYDKAVNSTESSLSVVMQHGTGAGTAGNETLSIYIDELLYGRAMPPISGPSGVLVTLPFEAYYNDDADATTIRMVLENAVASY